MLLYNTTYHVEQDCADRFMTWFKTNYIPAVIEEGLLTNPRLYKMLSHQEEGGQNICVQWDVEDSGVLHRWYTTQGIKLNEELVKMFEDKVIGFPTLLEVLE